MTNEMKAIGIVVDIPMDTAYFLCTMKFVDDQGKYQERTLMYDSHDLHWAYTDCTNLSEEFFLDHPETFAEESATEYPILFCTPETTYSLEFYFTGVKHSYEDYIADHRLELIGKKILDRSEIKKLHDDFQKYI